MERQSQEPAHQAVTDNAMTVPKDLALPNFDAVFMQVRVMTILFHAEENRMLIK